MKQKEKLHLENEVSYLIKGIPSKTLAVTYKMINGNKDCQIITEIKGDIREYEPYDFLECYLFAHARLVDMSKSEGGELDLTKQIKTLYSLKSDSVNLTERFKRYTAEYAECKKYDFSGFIKQVDSVVEKAKLNIEIKLLNSNISTNENTKKTNIINRWLLGGTTIFAFIAICISYFQYCIQKESYQLEIHKLREDKDKVILQQENKLLQAKMGKVTYLFDSIKNSLHDSLRYNLRKK